MQILENFKHAATFAQMSLGEKMIATLYVILLGMGITFVALILIWALSALMSRILRAVEEGAKPAVTEAPKSKAPVAIAAKEEEEDEALIAVITAAIAASLNTSMHNIIVTNITRVNDETPAWGRAGRSDVMNSRF